MQHDVSWSMTDQAPTAGLEVILESGLDSFSAIAATIRSAALAADRSVEDLVAGREESVLATMPSLLGGESASRGHFYNAENVGSSVIRRISRESIHLTDAIDDLATLVLELQPDSAAGPMVILGAEHLDRPSARVLYRAAQLADPGAIHWFWGFSATPLPRSSGRPLSIERRFRDSRDRLFSVLAEGLGARLDQSLGQLEVVDFGSPDDGFAVVTQVSQALVGQNYDRAYTAAAAGLDQLSAEDLSNVWRMICIADANMGRIDDAADSIDRARQAAPNRWLVSQCLYMSGLLETKRRYDLDSAEASYRAALALVDDDDEQSRVERAWATNGLSLVRTLRSKHLDAEDRDAELMQVFLDEAEVFQEVHTLTNAQALYLQLNLLANMALLLEVKGDFQRAASFWSRVFDKFRGISSPERRSFEVAFLYRLGLLLLKAGRSEDAMDAMKRGEAVPGVETRRFTLERLLYATGYVQIQSGHLAEAVETFSRGCVLAQELRYDVALGQHLAGLEACGEAGQAKRASWDRVVRDRGIDVPSEVAVPSPKFPSYVPLIDLEVAPQIDLNKFLANDRSGQSLQQALGRG